MSDILEEPCAREFIRLCDDGWRQGWHEANGGNLSYRLTDEEATRTEAAGAARGETDNWHPLGVEDATLAGARFLVTGAGRHFRDVAIDPEHSLGLVDIDAAGSAWRIEWGLDGARPTSEFAAHYLDHCALASRAGEARSGRVVYHAHTPNLVTLGVLLPPTAAVYSRALWKSITECIMVIPQGVGVVEWMLPGSIGLARATASLMATYDAVVWAQHGVIAAGTDFRTAFGLVHTLEKAAGIYLAARAASGGSDRFSQPITDAHLRAICENLNLAVAEEFLEE